MTFNSLIVLLHPVFEVLRHVLHLVHALAIHRLAVENPLRVRIHLLLGLEDGGGVAPAMGMPPRELEILRVLSLQLVADVCEGMRLAVTALAGVVAREVYFYPHHKVQVLPPIVVGGAVCHVRLGDGEPPRVLVRGAVDALPGMEGGGRARSCLLTIFTQKSMIVIKAVNMTANDLFPKKILVFLVAFLCFHYFCGKLNNNNLITTL